MSSSTVAISTNTSGAAATSSRPEVQKNERAVENWKRITTRLLTQIKERNAMAANAMVATEGNKQLQPGNSLGSSGVYLNYADAHFREMASSNPGGFGSVPRPLRQPALLFDTARQPTTQRYMLACRDPHVARLAQTMMHCGQSLLLTQNNMRFVFKVVRVIAVPVF